MWRILAVGIAVCVGIACSFTLLEIATTPPFPPNFGTIIFDPGSPSPFPTTTYASDGSNGWWFTFNSTSTKVWGEVLYVNGMGIGGHLVPGFGLVTKAFNRSVSSPILFNSLWVAPDGSSEVVWLPGTHCVLGFEGNVCGDELQLGVQGY
jgi:hypothetical protein